MSESFLLLTGSTQPYVVGYHKVLVSGVWLSLIVIHTRVEDNMFIPFLKICTARVVRCCAVQGCSQMMAALMQLAVALNPLAHLLESFHI